MTLDNAVEIHTTVFCGYKDGPRDYLRGYGGMPDYEILVPIYKSEPTGVIQLCAHGFTGRIHPNGRVTLDVGINYFGELFDGQAKGKTTKQIQTHGVKLLHEAIKKSGLRN